MSCYRHPSVAASRFPPLARITNAAWKKCSSLRRALPSPVLPSGRITARSTRSHTTSSRPDPTEAKAVAPKLPLHGIRILDMTRVLAGPYCTQMLGDLGADVIKIEHPVRGDDTRAWGPPFAAYTPESGLKGPGESAYFLGVNRNKRSAAISFKHPEGAALIRSLALSSDVVVENYLPGTLRRYGLDADTLRTAAPGLVYASLTGYGQTGPYAPRAGYDVMVEAEFGLMHVTGFRDRPPVKVGVAVTDLTTGLYTATGILAALFARTATGLGRYIDIALSDCQTATLANIATSCLVSGKPDQGRWGTAHPSIVPYRSFQTSDGQILLGGGNDRLFGILCDQLSHPEWKTDPRYLTNADRVTNRAELEEAIERETARLPTAAWLARLGPSGLPHAAVNDVQTTLQHPQTVARGMVQPAVHSACGPVRLLGSPFKMSGGRPGLRTPPPTLGQHTDEVLRERLGLGEDEIESLRVQGVIR